MTTIEKTVSNEITKWISFDLDIFHIKEKIKDCYYKISLGDYNDKKEYFIRLHYLKMLKQYIYLKIYHYNIKKISSNYKLLCYFESILAPRGFDIKKMEKYFLNKKINYLKIKIIKYEWLTCWKKL